MTEQADVMLLLLDELEQRNARLEQVNVDLRHFAQVAAHDLRSPLTLVRGYLEQVLRLDKDLAPRTVEWLNQALNAAMQMADLVDAVLDHTLSSGADLEVATVSLDQVFADALSRLRLVVAERDATVAVAPLPAVRGDRALLALVAQNLLDNALKFGREGVPPRVEVSAFVEPAPSGGLGRATCVVRVRDNGIGIPEGDRGSVFALFGRGAGQPRQAGHGIGLATCARIVERHGGCIRVADAEVPGTLIELELPLA